MYFISYNYSFNILLFYPLIKMDYSLPELNTIYTSSGQKIKLKNKYYDVMFFNNGYALGTINEKGTKIKILQKKWQF